MIISQMNKAIIILGAPGSGKGTQSNLLSEYLNYSHFSMGDLVRFQLKQKTSLGLKMQDYIDKGDLVPDDLIIDIFKDNVLNSSLDKSFISDGFPRTLNQAQKLDKMLDMFSFSSLILLIDVPESNLIDRLLNRNRFDDKIAIIHNRLKTYYSETSPILEYYSDRVIKINGNDDVDSIFNSIKSIIIST